LAPVSRSIEADENHGHAPAAGGAGRHRRAARAPARTVGLRGLCLSGGPLTRSPIFPGGVASGVRCAASTADVDQ
jgi:hypothetical protein